MPHGGSTMDKQQLERVLNENWPPNCIQLQCSKCNAVLYDVPKRNDPPICEPSYVATELIMHAKSHTDGTEHDAFDVVVDAPPKQTQEIDCTVTVTGQPNEIEGW